MTTLHISVPDQIASQAIAAGLWQSSTVTDFLKEALDRREKKQSFLDLLDELQAAKDSDVTPAVIAAEIKADRTERRARGA